MIIINRPSSIVVSDAVCWAVGPGNTLWGADRVWLLRVYQALILSRLDYGCVVYGSARASVLRRLDTENHLWCLQNFACYQLACGVPSTTARTKAEAVKFQLLYSCAISVPSHPLKPFSLTTGLARLYDARSFNIKPFSERAKAVLNDAHLKALVDLWRVSVPIFAKWSSISFPKVHNGKAPPGRQPLLEFCLEFPCNPGLGNFCLSYLPRSDWQNLNHIKLQSYQEWRDGQKTDEGPNE
ncbi:RNase H domain-containing protein [Trichonephila clavipes]|nr:RNase H domain-containing protein [Trichonephila clavipes]